MSRADRRPELDGLRALAALYVVAHHSWLTVYPSIYGRRPEGLAASLTGWLGYGQFAVAAFIVLSGYCLALPTLGEDRLSRGFVGYMYRRAQRIVPTYWAAVAVSTMLAASVLSRPTGTHWDIVLPLSTHRTAACVALVQDVTGGQCPNHVFWSIAVEWHIYLLLPALLWLIRKYGAFVALTAAALMLTLASAVIAELGSRWLSLNPQMYVLFVLGVASCRLAESAARGPWLLAAVGFVGVTAAGVAVYGVPTPASATAVILDLPMGGAVACLLLSAASRPGLRRAMGWRPLAFIGGFSYSLYLIHAPLLQLAWQLFVRPTGLTGLPALVITLATGATTAVTGAWVLHISVERRFMYRRSEMTPTKSRVFTAAAATATATATARFGHLFGWRRDPNAVAVQVAGSDSSAPT